MKKISLGEAFRSLFSTPNKWVTIMLLCVCLIIPIVGPIVMMGYMIGRLVNENQERTVTDFQFDYFGEYLKLGLWPFLVSLVVSLIATPVMMVALVPIFGIAANPESAGLAIGMIALSFILFVGAIIVMMLFTYPMMIRAAMTQSFGEAFKMGWVFSFIKKVGVQIIFWGFILMIISIPLMIVGMLALYVGSFIVSTVLSFVSYHLMFQMYVRFVDKGGQPVEVHPDVIGRPGQFWQPDGPPPLQQSS